MEMDLQKVMPQSSPNGGDYRGEEAKYVVIDGDDEEEGEEDGPLPGFRFHPTDEELVSFYLRRKVKRKSISIEIIREVDIYKHDPWDLAKASSLGEKEWYFYCKRGRKYRNSIRPNRVTGSGFWKATGIDRPIYGNKGDQGHHHCIGLKKSLVYYRGSAGKGTKTDWMMHEFRLPGNLHLHQQQQQQLSTSPEISFEEAEIWTLCRIFKRNRKYTPGWREFSTKRVSSSVDSSMMMTMMMNSKVCNSAQSSNKTKECYISFENPATQHHHQQQQPLPQYHQQKVESHESYGDFDDVSRLLMEDSNNLYLPRNVAQWRCPSMPPICAPSNRLDYSRSFTTPSSDHAHAVDQSSQLIADAVYNDNLDDLSSVVEYAIGPLPNIGYST